MRYPVLLPYLVALLVLLLAATAEREVVAEDGLLHTNHNHHHNGTILPAIVQKSVLQNVNITKVSEEEAMASAADSHTEEEEEKEEERLEEISMGILFLSMLIFLGGTVFMSLKNKIPLPYTVVLFLYGIVVGAIAKWVYPEVSGALGSIPPELLFYIFLPVLIFEGSYAMNIHALRRVFAQTVLLASVGIVINTALLSIVVKLMFGWSWYTACLLGSLLSATDPVAVVSLLKGLQVDKCITAMVDGEAVMNDGTAIIIFSLLLPAAKAGTMTEPFWLIILKCLQLSFLPIILGPLFGFIQSFWLRKTVDSLTRACITVSVTYVSYYIANTMIGASGVLTLFFEGVFLSYYYPSQFPGCEGNLIYSTWEFLVHLGNTVLFSLVGVILVEDVFPTLEFVDIFYIIVLYLSMILARLAMLEVLLPVLNRVSSVKVDQKTVLLLVHAGLRGGVAATLALAVFQEGLEEGVAVLKLTCGVVFCTLVINAPTSGMMVKYLGFNAKEKFKCIRMSYGLSVLKHGRDAALDRLKRDTKYRNTEWLQVENYVSAHLENPYKDSRVIEEEDDKALNRILMSAFKTAMWRQRDEHILSETIIIEMGRVISRAITKGELFRLRDIQFYHKVLDGPPMLFGKKKTKERRPTAADVEVPVTPPSGRLPEVRSEASATHAEEENAFPAGVEVHRFVPPPYTEPESSIVLSMEEQGQVTMDEERDAMLSAMMERLLPTWITLAERFIFGKGYFKRAHQRAQENAFMTLLAISKSLASMQKIKYRHASSREEADRIDRWVRVQLYDVNAAIRFFYKNFHQATHNVASQRAVLSLANSLHSTVEELHMDHGFDRSVTESLEHMIHALREEMPSQWALSEAVDGAASTELVTRAVAATSLGRGMHRLEIQAITAMGIVRHLTEDDVITLPNSAFLIVIFGTIKALHGSWTTIADHESAHNFGDTVGLDSFLIQRPGHQRQWRVLSTDATLLIVGFNSIRPFLMERSLRGVRALWRGVATEVLLPFLNEMISPVEAGDNKRELLKEMISQGKPLIGEKACNACKYGLPNYFVFYLRGSDKHGLFRSNSLPQLLSSFYSSQLRWSDSQTVLYVIPVSITSSVYLPWPKARLQQQQEAPSAMLSLSPSVASVDSLPTTVDSNADSSFTRFDRFISRSHIEEEEQVPAEQIVEVLGHLLLGRLPNGGDTTDEEDSMDEEDMDYMTSPLLRDGDDNRFCCYSDTLVSILQDISLFITPVPYVNTLFMEYAYYLERVCVAAYRYVKFPFEPNNVIHARRTSQSAIEFLLSFSVELSLLKRAVRYLSREHADVYTHGTAREEEEDINDAAFQTRIVALSRRSAFTHSFHLKHMITDMNVFANRRFHSIKLILESAVRHREELKDVFTVEQLNTLVSQLEKEYNANRQEKKRE
ncbi:Na/H antiporter-like protein [Angomonas deanei]|nr:Na/H antiporter-like protein [Angomonas deanei]|eukprot:EPY28949.1 Na/H antiporter-like protein [Angomonas deanei]